jgi:hypothetical protein
MIRHRPYVAQDIHRRRFGDAVSSTERVVAKTNMAAEHMVMMSWDVLTAGSHGNGGHIGNSRSSVGEREYCLVAIRGSAIVMGRSRMPWRSEEIIAVAIVDQTGQFAINEVRPLRWSVAMEEWHS